MNATSLTSITTRRQGSAHICTLLRNAAMALDVELAGERHVEGFTLGLRVDPPAAFPRRPGRIRTSDPLLRRQPLCPLSYRGLR